MILLRRREGVTIVEILISGLILTIAAASSYAVMLSVIQVGNMSRNEIEALANASSWLDRVRMGITSASRYNGLRDDYNTNGTVDRDLNAEDSVYKKDYKNEWSVASNANVTNLTASYNIDEVNLGSGTPFMRVRVDINWDK